MLLILVIVTGCAAVSSNVAREDYDYYKKNLSASNNLKNIKEFLSSSNIKLIGVTITDNKPLGSFGNININGTRMSYASPEFNTMSHGLANSLTNLELGGYYVLAKDLEKHAPLKNGKYFNTSFCLDYSHTNVAPDNSSISLPIIYLVSVMSKEQAQAAHALVKVWDCDGYEFGEIIYKKKIISTSNINDLKVSYELKPGASTLTDNDRFTYLVADAIAKGVVDRINDVDMLQAMKDYTVSLSTNNASSEAQKTSNIKEKSSGTEDTLGLEDAKNSCKDLGFKLGSKEFGNCVLKLSK